MAKRFEKTVETVKKLSEKLRYAVKSGKIFFVTGCNVAP
jgi:hypothetical protein